LFDHGAIGRGADIGCADVAGAFGVVSENGFGRGRGSVFFDEGNDGTAEAATGKSGSDDARAGSGQLDEEIQLGGAIFEIVAGAFMGGSHELTEGGEVAVGEDDAAGANAFIFSGDVESAAFDEIGEIGTGEFGRGGVAKLGHADSLGGGETLFPAFVVFASGEGVLDAAVDDEKFPARGDGFAADRFGAAIEVDEVVGFSKDRRGLVQEAAIDPDEFVLRSTAELGQFEGGEVEVEKFGQECGGADFHGGGAGEAGAERQGRAEVRGKSTDGVTGVAENFGHAEGVISPGRGG
jgi:hypothetical protein